MLPVNFSLYHLYVDSITRNKPLSLSLSHHNEEALMKATPMSQVGKAFHKVIESCMGMDLKPNWRDTIDHFTLIYRQSDMSVTPKVSDMKCFPQFFVCLL